MPDNNSNPWYHYWDAGDTWGQRYYDPMYKYEPVNLGDWEPPWNTSPAPGGGTPQTPVVNPNNLVMPGQTSYWGPPVQPQTGGTPQQQQPTGGGGIYTDDNGVQRRRDEYGNQWYYNEGIGDWSPVPNAPRTTYQYSTDTYVYNWDRYQKGWRSRPAPRGSEYNWGGSEVEKQLLKGLNDMSPQQRRYYLDRVRRYGIRGIKDEVNKYLREQGAQNQGTGATTANWANQMTTWRV